jgi:hypothetical protein
MIIILKALAALTGMLLFVVAYICLSIAGLEPANDELSLTVAGICTVCGLAFFVLATHRDL